MRGKRFTSTKQLCEGWGADSGRVLWFARNRVAGDPFRKLACYYLSLSADRLKSAVVGHCIPVVHLRGQSHPRPRSGRACPRAASRVGQVSDLPFLSRALNSRVSCLGQRNITPPRSRRSECYPTLPSSDRRRPPAAGREAVPGGTTPCATGTCQQIALQED